MAACPPALTAFPAGPQLCMVVIFLVSVIIYYSIVSVAMFSAGSPMLMTRGVSFGATEGGSPVPSSRPKVGILSLCSAPRGWAPGEGCHSALAGNVNISSTVLNLGLAPSWVRSIPPWLSSSPSGVSEGRGSQGCPGVSWELGVLRHGLPVPHNLQLQPWCHRTAQATSSERLALGEGGLGTEHMD